MKRKKRNQFFWLMTSYFEGILKTDLNLETKEIIGKYCPKSFMAVQIENWRKFKQKIYVKENTVKNFKVKIIIEKKLPDGYCQVSFPGEIPKNQFTKAVVHQRFISKNP
jgi:hypothetical protein